MFLFTGLLCIQEQLDDSLGGLSLPLVGNLMFFFYASSWAILLSVPFFGGACHLPRCTHTHTCPEGKVHGALSRALARGLVD